MEFVSPWRSGRGVDRRGDRAPPPPPPPPPHCGNPGCRADARPGGGRSRSRGPPRLEAQEGPADALGVDPSRSCRACTSRCARGVGRRVGGPENQPACELTSFIGRDDGTAVASSRGASADHVIGRADRQDRLATGNRADDGGLPAGRRRLVELAASVRGERDAATLTALGYGMRARHGSERGPG